MVEISHAEYDEIVKKRKQASNRVNRSVPRLQDRNDKDAVPKTDPEPAPHRSIDTVKPQKSPEGVVMDMAGVMGSGLDKEDIMQTGQPVQQQPGPEQHQCGNCLAFLSGPIDRCPYCGTEFSGWE